MDSSLPLQESVGSSMLFNSLFGTRNMSLDELTKVREKIRKEAESGKLVELSLFQTYTLVRDGLLYIRKASNISNYINRSTICAGYLCGQDQENLELTPYPFREESRAILMPITAIRGQPGNIKVEWDCIGSYRDLSAQETKSA